MMHESSFLHSHIRDTGTCSLHVYSIRKKTIRGSAIFAIVVHELKVENAELGQEAQNLR
jgi:hypothetical protein